MLPSLEHYYTYKTYDMKYTTTLLLLIFTIATSFSQREETVFGRNGVQLTGAWGGMTNGMIRFQDEFSLNNGGYFMFELNDNFLIGWSGYGNGEVLADGKDVDIEGNDLILGYTFNSYKAVHPAMYIKGGRGKLDVASEGKENISVIEPSLGIEVNVFRWMRVGLEGGYRFVSGVDRFGLSDSDLSSPVVGLRFKFGWSWR